MERVLRDRIARDLFDEGSQKARFTLPKGVRSPFIRTTHPGDCCVVRRRWGDTARF
jgi:hypothetical protein